MDLEALKEKYRNLESQALTDKERLELLTEKVNDYQAAIENLKEERAREEKEKDRFLALYISESEGLNNEKALHSKTEAAKLALEIEKGGLESKIRVKQIELEKEQKEIENLKSNHQGQIEIKEIEIENLKKTHQDELKNKDKQLENKQIEIDTATNHFKEEEQKRHAEWTQYRHWEGEVARKNHQLETLEKKNEQLTQELREAKEQAKPGLTGWLAEKTGFAYVKDVFYGGFVFFVAIILIWLISWLWKWVIQPTIKNFTPTKKVIKVQENQNYPIGETKAKENNQPEPK